VNLRRTNLIGFVVVHMIAALALLPWFFSWTGVILYLLGVHVLGVLGINVGYHRLLTHRGFTCPLWLEHALAVLGVCSMQDSPSFWVAAHRRHHQFADQEQDPHTPLAGFFWAHVGWMLVKPDDPSRHQLIQRYVKDLSRDPFYGWLEQSNHSAYVALLSWLVFFAAGFALMAATGHTLSAAVQFGLSLLVWGGALRTAVHWHLTWAVNSVTHVWGYRNYASPDVSRNNTLIALLTAGEGWHNNHHAESRSARHGHEWWEFDLTWLMIRGLMLLGLAWNVATPAPNLKAKFNGAKPAVDPAADPEAAMALEARID
jgi:fatty-acid desaturase